jgi:GH3 auxin-responsive promoter
MNKTSISNALWLFSQKQHYQFFCKHIEQPQSVQNQCLMNYIRTNTDTEFGQKHDFANIHSYKDFIKQVPIIENFDNFRSYTEGVAAGRQNVLTAEKVLFFEETSGSTAQSKLIPYNATLKNEFQKAVAVWMCDLKKQNPACFHGRAYWSLSPALKKGFYTEGGIPVGIPDDTAYFNPFAAYLLKNIMAVPSAELLKITDSKAFYIATLQALLAQESLSFISVWSPVFFLQLDQFLKNHFDEVLKGVKTNQKRYQNLLFLKNKDFQWSELFPNLNVLSCWTNAQAALWLPEVQNRLGTIKIQGKGLLATEGVTTIPFGQGDPALAYTSHFYEFKCLKTNDIYVLENLKLGHDYAVILTTGGGLYRYATHDIVTVTGFESTCPRLKFQGRQNVAVDMVGEKLHETHVNQAIIELTASYTEGGKKIVFLNKGVFIYGIQNPHQAQYKVLINNPLNTDISLFLKDLETHFCQNPYYRQARDLGQLLPLEAVFVPENFVETLTEFYKKRKHIRDGDIKLPLIYPPLFLVDVLGF